MNISKMVDRQGVVRILTPYFVLLVLAVALGVAGADAFGNDGDFAVFYRAYFPVLPIVAATIALMGIVFCWDAPPHRLKFLKMLALVAGVGIGVVLWWLYFRSGINQIILSAALLGFSPAVAPGIFNRKLPINGGLVWLVGFFVVVGVGIWFGVPLWVAFSLAWVVIFGAFVIVNLDYDKANENSAENLEWMDEAMRKRK